MINIFDDARKHFKSDDYPSHLPIENAYLHIGIFIGWIIERNMYSYAFREEFDAQIIRFKRGEFSNIILGELWDGYIYSEQLNAEGLAFTRQYYQSGKYFEDLKERLASTKNTIYQIADTPENFRLMMPVIDARFAEWKKQQAN